MELVKGGPMKMNFENNRSWFWFVSGAAAGSFAIFLFDPVQGSRRRALIRDKTIKFTRLTALYGGKIRRDLLNRAFGIAAEISPLRESTPVDDATLNDRIRSEFGRVIRHAKSINTKVEDGVVRLTGPILASEVDDLIEHVKSIRGVTDIINQLDVHETPDNIPGLQGEGKPYLQ